MCESKPNLNEFLEEVSLIRSRISNVLSILGKEDLEYILARLRTISTKSEDFHSNFSKYREKLEEIKQNLKEAVELPLKKPEIFSRMGKRRKNWNLH